MSVRAPEDETVVVEEGSGWTPAPEVAGEDPRRDGAGSDVAWTTAPASSGFVHDAATEELWAQWRESRRWAVPARRRSRARRRRERRRRAVGWVLVLALAGAGASAFVATAPHAAHRRPPGPVDALPPSSLVWAVDAGRWTLLTVVALPGGQAPAVVVIPAQAQVDLPAGGPTVAGGAGTRARLALATAEAALDARIGHYLLTRPATLVALVDRLGGVGVQAEPFTYGGATVGPGPVRMEGAEAIAYLDAASGPADATARFEGLLTGILAARRPGAWSSGPLGVSDDVTGVARMLAAAGGAVVSELPTASTLGGGEGPDVRAVRRLVASLGRSLGGLVRVVVENGNGVPGAGLQLDELLAPYGFRVVASENAGGFDVRRTEIVAADAAFLPWAERVRQLIGVGRVYVGRQNTGIADVLVIVGKDERAA